MQVLIKGKALTDVLEGIIQAYYDFCPTEAARFDEMVRTESKFLKKANGMTEEGCFLSLMRLPSNELYRFIRLQVRKRCNIDDFFRDPENYRLLARVWTNAKIKRRPTPILQVK